MSLTSKYFRFINCLKDENREIRMNAINELFNLFNLFDQINNDEINELMNLSFSNILLTISDFISQIRIKSLQIIHQWVKYNIFKLSENEINQIFPTIYGRLNYSNNKFIEPIEETRILIIQILQDIFTSSSKWNLNLYISDFMNVLSKLCIDPNPEMKEIIADFICKIIDFNKQINNKSLLEQISLSNKNLIIAISKNTFHQRNKIRKESLIALNKLLIINPIVFSDIHFIYKKLISDKNNEVRLTTISCLSELVINFNITYLNKFESIIISYIMMNLSDIDENIKYNCYNEIEKLGSYRLELKKSLEDN